MIDYEKKLIDDYNKYFISYNMTYSSPQKQAEQFQIVSVLKNVQTNVTENSVINNNKQQKLST